MAKTRKTRKRRKMINAAISVQELKDGMHKGMEVVVSSRKLEMSAFVSDLDVRTSESGLRRVTITLQGTRAPRRTKRR